MEGKLHSFLNQVRGTDNFKISKNWKKFLGGRWPLTDLAIARLIIRPIGLFIILAFFISRFACGLFRYHYSCLACLIHEFLNLKIFQNTFLYNTIVCFFHSCFVTYKTSLSRLRENSHKEIRYIGNYLGHRLNKYRNCIEYKVIVIALQLFSVIDTQGG